MESRDIRGGPSAERQWYQYGRSQSLTIFDTPKIIVRVMSIAPLYYCDDSNIMFTTGGNGPYIMVRANNEINLSNHYLLAVLNHPLSEAFIRTNTSTFRGGYYSHGKQFIENLPIPIPDEEQRTEIEDLVRTLIDTLDQLSAARTPRDHTRFERDATDQRNAIESRISTVFGLSEEDMETVRTVPVPT